MNDEQSCPARLPVHRSSFLVHRSVSWHFCCSSITSSVRRADQPGGRSMNIIGWLLFGLIVGAIAKFLMPGRDPGGWIVTILLGIAGSFVGGFFASMLGHN